MNRIVVGVDGSEESNAALRFALAEARLRSAEVLAVHAWTYPVAPGPGFAPPSPVPIEVLRRDAEELLDSAVAEAMDGARDVTVATAAVEGAAADVLVEASEEAELLVVGSRGRGGVAELLLGSVSQHCAHHASCPVVIVRPPRRNP